MSNNNDELTLLGKGGPKEKIVRDWFVRRFGNASEILDEEQDAAYPNSIQSKQLKEIFDTDVDGVDVGYGSFNAVLKKIKKELGINDEVEINISTDINSPAVGVVGSAAVEVDLEEGICNIKELELPEVRLYKTGKGIDLISSDHEEGGGTYGGTVYVVIGESGVGKSTILLDQIKSAHYGVANDEVEHDITCLEDTENLYISSEMTRNDLGFYYKKTPAIGDVPTLILMDYMRQPGGMVKILEKAFRSGKDMIVLDSYEDVIVKLRDICGMSRGQAETFVIGLMTEAAEKYGSTVYAIQHMTKSGDYAGSTFLKHCTTGMMELRFTKDKAKRYVQWVKNRRGGSQVYKKLFFTLDENGDVAYDMHQFNKAEDAHVLKENEEKNTAEIENQFDNIFKLVGESDGDEESSGLQQGEQDNDVETIELEVVDTTSEDEEDQEEQED